MHWGSYGVGISGEAGGEDARTIWALDLPTVCASVLALRTPRSRSAPGYSLPPQRVPIDSLACTLCPQPSRGDNCLGLGAWRTVPR